MEAQQDSNEPEEVSEQFLFVNRRNWAGRAWGDGWRAAAWIAREFGEPTLCWGCVYIGVAMIMCLSPALLLLIIAASPSDLTITPLAAIPISIHIWNQRAYTIWCDNRKDRLGARILRAIGTGVTLGLR
jgi:hypothetical protein